MTDIPIPWPPHLHSAAFDEVRVPLVAIIQHLASHQFTLHEMHAASAGRVELAEKVALQSVVTKMIFLFLSLRARVLVIPAMHPSTWTISSDHDRSILRRLLSNN